MQTMTARTLTQPAYHFWSPNVDASLYLAMASSISDLISWPQAVTSVQDVCSCFFLISKIDGFRSYTINMLSLTMFKK